MSGHFDDFEMASKLKELRIKFLMSVPNSPRRSCDTETFSNLLLARKLASFRPTSLSVDDLCKAGFEPELKSASYTLSREYIPPLPKVGVIRQESPAKDDQKLQNHRFALLLEDVPKQTCETAPAKMDYKLPNVVTIPSKIRKKKPLMVVSLSGQNLQGMDMGQQACL